MAATVRQAIHSLPSCGKHKGSGQDKCQCAEYLLNTQAFQCFALSFDGCVHLCQCDTSGSNGIYVRAYIHPVINTAAPVRATMAPAVKGRVLIVSFFNLQKT